MKGGSLFSGVGCFEIAAVLARLNVDWCWQVECDADCRRVLEHHFPRTDRSVIDVREASASNLEPVDIIVGGFPCQDISVAGNGTGLAGERSGLWNEYARIVRELRPRFVVVENSPALLSRGFDVVAGDLAACGYDLEWDCVPAGAVGAPHRRDRIWIVAHAPRPRLEGRRKGLPAHSARGYWRKVAPPKPTLCRVDDGAASRVDRLAWGRRRAARLRQLGNAIVPQVAAIALQRVAELDADQRTAAEVER